MTYEVFKKMTDENLALIKTQCGNFANDMAGDLFYETPHILALGDSTMIIGKEACITYLLMIMILEDNPKCFLDIFMKQMKDYCRLEENKKKSIFVWNQLYRAMGTVEFGRLEGLVWDLCRSKCKDYFQFTIEKRAECVLLIGKEKDKMLTTLQSQDNLPIPWDHHGIWDNWK